jgi:integrase
VKRIRLKEGFKPEPGMTVYPREAFAIPYEYECKPLWRAYCQVRTKTRKQRLLPLAATLAPDLKAYIEKTERGLGNLIWTRPDGKPIDPMEDLTAWKAALLRAGIPEAGTHISRHTANTLLLKRGVPEELRKQILGHSTAVAYEAYTHVDLEMAREAMGKLGDLLPPARG